MLIAVAVAALAFAVGRFSTFGSSGPLAPANDSAEAGFARDMQVHHAQAVEMAMILYPKTETDVLRTLAYDLATGQSAQSGQMYEWLAMWGLPQAGEPIMSWIPEENGGHAGHGGTGEQPTDAEMRESMGMASEAEMEELRAATGQAADCLFLELMIRHHEGAVHMVDAILELGQEARVKQVASGMKATQSAEIDAMESLQASLACH